MLRKEPEYARYIKESPQLKKQEEVQAQGEMLARAMCSHFNDTHQPAIATAHAMQAPYPPHPMGQNMTFPAHVPSNTMASHGGQMMTSGSQSAGLGQGCVPPSVPVAGALPVEDGGGKKLGELQIHIVQAEMGHKVSFYEPT